MHHDSFCCGQYSNSIPFPVRRLNAEYVAAIHYHGSPALPETCPEKCRPKDHPDWIRC